MTRHLYLFIVVLLVVNYPKAQNLIGRKFNVVLFLASTSTSEYYQHDSGIKYLNFIEKARVKHCATGGDPLASVVLGSDCKELLKTGIFSLIGYCRNVLGMTTAVASLENDTFSNGLRFKKSASEDLEIRFHNSRSLPSHSDNQFDQSKTKSHYITEPEHTEIFKIRTKRQLSDEIPDFEAPDEENKDWDVFGIVANIKLTFFGKLFEKDKSRHQQVLEQTQNQVMDQIGKVSENNLFDLVKETLVSVEDSESGFLMITIGGCLTQVSDIYSSLMQSVKHVVENTDESNTLIVVTGTCPPVDGVSQSGGDFSIPVYVKGPPEAMNINFADQLYDVPYAIKNLLSELNGGNDLMGLNGAGHRGKRHLKTKTKRNNASNILDSILALLLCILTLFLAN